MTSDKWQQCLKTLAKEHPKSFGFFGETLVWQQGKGFTNNFVLGKETQDQVDEIAALLGKKIYVYQMGIGKAEGAEDLRVEVRHINHNVHYFHKDTGQTSKLEATKEGLMSIVEKL